MMTWLKNKLSQDATADEIEETPDEVKENVAPVSVRVNPLAAVRVKPADTYVALIGLMFATGVYADVAQVPVEVEFVDPISIKEDSELNFGLLDVTLASGDTVTIAPDSGVTESTPRVVGGIQGAADLTVTTTASQPITILVDNVSSATGYTLGTWMCKYDGGADSACDSGGYTVTAVANATLLIGVTLTGSGSAVVGTDNSAFDVTITYQ